MDASIPTSDQLQLRGAEQAEWHALAKAKSDEVFGGEVFVRGVVEVSNFCRENCRYCGMRRDNRELARYRANFDQLAELLLHHRPESITDMNFQAGEDPLVVREVVVPLVKLLREETNLGVSVCLGTLNDQLYRELWDAGARMYIIKFEIGDQDLYAQMEAPGKWEERLEHIRRLSSDGWFVSSGFISGLPGQGIESTLKNFEVARDLPLDGCSVSPFIPGEATPLMDRQSADLDLTLNCMAALRHLRPDWVIPSVSALNLTAPGEGYRRGIAAGANLCTINLTPPAIRDDYLLYKRSRFIVTEELILNAIEEAGMRPSTAGMQRLFTKQVATVSEAL